jgi:lysine 2,3-aminomutase
MHTSTYTILDNTLPEWRDWKWQLKNRLRSADDISAYFPKFPENEKTEYREYLKKFRISITPYYLSLIARDNNGNPLPGDPLWMQVSRASCDPSSANGYDGIHLNWETPGEFPTQILHHKYPGRAILRIIDRCASYCNYCYLTKRVLDKSNSAAATGFSEIWKQTLGYIEKSGINDVLISGGEPFLMSDERLMKVISGLRAIPSVRTIRVNTRILSFIPFRIGYDTAVMLRDGKVTAIEIHAAHPREITPEFDEALGHFDRTGYRPLILWRAPILHGVNDSVETLKELFLKLYERRIVPYYIFHFAPYSLGRHSLGTSVRRGAELLSDLRRIIPGPAFPRYTLFHPGGKQDIPLDPKGSPEFQYISDDEGRPWVSFRNWKGEWVRYPDIADEGQNEI